jgi:hypothetical protein
MDLTLKLLHAACAAVLFAAHSAFLFRGLAIESGRVRPGRFDHLARGLSQILLPVTVLSGLILRLAGGRTGGGEADLSSPSLLHLLLGLAPMAAIPVAFLTRILLKKRRQAPWLLPVVNLMLLAAAVATGIVVWR